MLDDIIKILTIIWLAVQIACKLTEPDYEDKR